MEDNKQFMIPKDEVMKKIADAFALLSENKNLAKEDVDNLYGDIYRYYYHSMAYTDSDIKGALDQLGDLVDRISISNDNEKTSEKIEKSVLLSEMKTLTELVRADTSLQDKDVREEDQKAITEEFEKLNSYYDEILGKDDDELRVAKEELDDAIKSKQEAIGIYESVGFEMTISDAELDTLMNQIGIAMDESDTYGAQITNKTEEQLHANYGQYQALTAELKELNDKKDEKDSMTKPAIIKATKNIAELYKKSEEEFNNKLIEIQQRESRLIQTTERQRKQEYDTKKEKMLLKYEDEMDLLKKRILTTNGADKIESEKRLQNVEMRYNKLQSAELPAFSTEYSNIQQEKAELFEEQNKTRRKYKNYVDKLEDHSLKLGIYEEFAKYKPIISAPVGEKREEPFNKTEGPVIPEQPLMLTDGREKINPDDITYHLTKDQIIQDDLSNPNGNNGNNGNNGGDPGSPRTTGADEPGIDVPILPTGKNENGDNPDGPTDNPTPDDPTDPNGLEDPSDLNKQNGEDEPENKQEQELPTGKIRIVAKKTWEWIKDHPAKSALIGIGVASLIYIIAQVAPLLVAAAKYGAIKGMFVNGGKWAAADAITKGNLHAGNVALSKIIGKGAFDSATGIWTFGGQSIEATAAALGETLSAASIKAAAGHYGAAILAGAGALGANSLLHSKEYKEYAKRICEFKKTDHKSQVEAEQIANNIKNDIHTDERLKSSDKDALIKRVNNAKRKIDNKLDTTIGPEQRITLDGEMEQPEATMDNEEMLKEAIGMLQAQGMSQEDIQEIIDGMLKERQAAM